MKGIKQIIILLLLSAGLYAQTDKELIAGASDKTLRKLGKNALKQHDPSRAITFLEPYVKKHPEDAATMAQLGRAYMEIRDYDRAQRTFLAAYRVNREKAPEALYYHAQMQKSNGLYDSARINFTQFKKEYKGPAKSLKKQAGKEIVFCDSVKKLVNKEGKIVIQRMDNKINKVNSEGAPIAMNDSTMLFSSLRTDSILYVIEDDTAEIPKKKIYTATRKKNVWRFDGEFKYLNDEDYNNGNVSFSADRKRIYFTRCKMNMKNEMICAIYVSEKFDNTWGEPRKLPSEVNNRRYSSTMPAVTTDPVKGNDVIYYVTNHKGRGGWDIWYTVYDRKKGIYKTPKNAGNKVNTIQDEISPFFDNETRTLYFSSNGQGGLGGHDIYMAKGDGKRFTSVENLGQPFNTGADDIYYTISTNRGEGFFASNRKGGNAIKNRTCCDDIYYYKRSDYIHVDLVGTVTDALDDNVPLANATIEVYIKDKITKEKFLVRTTTSDSLGHYKTKLEPNQEYVIVTKKKDILSMSEEVTTTNIIDNKTIHRDIKTVKRPKGAVKIPNIYFEFGSAELTPASKMGLELTLLEMLRNNPELIVEIGAHTDAKGNDGYNQRLSQKRADAMVAYLISRGIDREHLRATGYGEKEPVAPNNNPDGSDNPAGRDKNRRVEFKIIGTLDEWEIQKQGPE